MVRPLYSRDVFAAAIVWIALSATALGHGPVVVRLEAEPETNWSQPGFWETVDGQPPELSWQFVDGEVRLATPRGGKGSLLSGPLPPNFKLSWKWKLDERTNSGLKYRVRRFGSRLLGMEYQIIDEPAGTAGKGSCASIYDLVPPRPDKDLKPAGQWNDARIVANGHHTQHYLNGSLVAETDTWGPSWESFIAKSKFWNATDFGKPANGDRFMLTDHGGKVAYKDFAFTSLLATDESPPSVEGPFLGNALRNGWADQDSITIWTRTTRYPEMVSDGPEFVRIEGPEYKRLSGMTDAEQILNAQLPADVELSAMLGACPGAPGEVRLTYFPELSRKATKTTTWISTVADSDFTAQWHLTDLKPGTRYAAVVETRPIGGSQISAVVRGGFRTAPKINQPDDLSFCITTCHDFLRRDDEMAGHKIYPVMSRMAPDFVVHAGDIEYYDKPDPWAMTIELMRFKWARIFSLPSNRSFYGTTTSYFIKDDHDTLKNDCWAGQSYGSVSFAEGVKLFNDEQFPSHDPRFKTVRWGRDLQIWLIEGRDFRSPNNMPDGPEKTILGSVQREWLLKTLDSSPASFKLILSPTPIVGPDRKNKRDNHANDTFAHEGAWLRNELSSRDGVIVFCGDRHWQYASVDPGSGLWEFGCGPGSEKHQFGWKKGDVRPTHRFLRVAGGFLSGELRYADDEAKTPTLTIQHRKVNGDVVSEFTFPSGSSTRETSPPTDSGE